MSPGPFTVVGEGAKTTLGAKPGLSVSHMARRSLVLSVSTLRSSGLLRMTPGEGTCPRSDGGGVGACKCIVFAFAHMPGSESLWWADTRPKCTFDLL